MPQRPVGNSIPLGAFVLAGLGYLLAVLFLLGRKQNLFSRSIAIEADFRNVSGLLTGNNVRLGGITVGTAGFNQNMAALQHNFLLRGYFRRLAQKKARATTDSLDHLNRAR